MGPRAGLALLWLGLAACGGGEAPPPPAGTPKQAAEADEEGGAPPAPAAGKQAAKAPQRRAPVDTSAAASDSTQLQREVFSYRGAGRDPFLSLLRSSDVRPLVADIRVSGITYDATYPARSVAVIRDTAEGKRYAVRVGDELGRMRVSEIRRDAVVVTVDDFGQERQVVLPVRRRQEENP